MTTAAPEAALRRWGYAWLALVAAFALHVLDEALTGFLPLYNRVVAGLRDSYPMLPLPTFTFAGWLTTLIVALVILAALSPLAFRGSRPLRILAYVFSVIMLLNAIGHVAISIAWGQLAPGVYSSPVLFVAAIALFVTTSHAHDRQEH